MKILLLHGPNLNLLGTREPEVYGSMTLDDINEKMIQMGKELGAEMRCTQSNHEGALIDALHDISAIEIPVVEVHLSNVYAREEFRHVSMISAVCKGKITGFGWQSYPLGLRALIDILQE